MIHIESGYEKGKYTLSAVGHANTAPDGEDLVCAAASILVQTAAQILRQAQKENKATGGCCYMEKGDTVLTAYELSGETLLQLEGIEEGFLLLAKDFPQAVCFQKKR